MAINKLTMSQMIYEKLKEDIVSKHYLPGDQLKEVWVAKELEVSPTPVREAFKQLQSEGFLESIPYKGVFVKEYTADEVRMAYMVRAKMESLALRLIMETITEDEALILTQIMDESLKNETEHPYKRFLPFHDWIIRNTRTKIIINTLTSLNGVINIDIVMTDRKQINEKQIIDNHKELFDLIKNHDILASEKYIENMIINQIDDLLNNQ